MGEVTFPRYALLGNLFFLLELGFDLAIPNGPPQRPMVLLVLVRVGDGERGERPIKGVAAPCERSGLALVASAR